MMIVHTRRITLCTLGLLVSLFLVFTLSAHAQDQASRAAELGKKFQGVTLNIQYEGVQAGAVQLFAPQWEKLTGMKINVIAVPYAEQYTKALLEHQAGTGGLDIILASYHWVPDLVENGVIIPITDYMKQHLTAEEIADIEPGRRIAVMEYGADTWGMLVDGDAWLNYHRKDLFEDEANKAEYKAKFGHDLVPPRTMEEYKHVAQFFTEKYAPDLYGVAEGRAAGQAFFWFFQNYQAEGGTWFDPETMEPLINKELGVRVLKDMVELQKWGPPNADTMDAVGMWSEFLKGNLAMAVTWPPLGRFAEELGSIADYPSWLPRSEVSGKVGYAIPPGGKSELSADYIWTISSDSQNKDAAWAFMMWWSSPQMATPTSMLPNSLMDPYRISQFESPLYRNAWSTAGDYLDTLRAAGKVALVDLKVIGGTEYADALDQAVVAAAGGADPQMALDEAARLWKEITERIGVDTVKQSYQNLLDLQRRVQEAAQ